ncbi:MAG: hypothetical protein ABJN84_13060 [Flavobacteriaceae bacterium]
MFKLINYLKFLLKSTNQHGVHSPFVFSYVTKCIYSKQDWDVSKSANVLLKSIDYFNYRVVDLRDNQSLQTIVNATFSNLEMDAKPADIIYIEDLNIHFEDLLSRKLLHNGSMIFVNAIHQNPRKMELWKKLIQMAAVRVSIDMFHCGIIFVRREQEKEHFTIRI